MRISQKGIDLIKQYEGWSAVPYMCSANKKTIGYGHVMLPGENWSTITEEFGEDLLQKDLEKFEAHVLKLVKVPMTQDQFDALVSFTFNLGPGSLQKSTLLRKVNAQEFDAASKEFSKWVFAAGKKLKGLERRREAEAKLFRGEA